MHTAEGCVSWQPATLLSTYHIYTTAAHWLSKNVVACLPITLKMIVFGCLAPLSPVRFTNAV